MQSNSKYIKRNLLGEALIVYKKNLRFNKLQKQVLIGTLLGDASIPKQYKKSSYNIKFEQKVDNKAYIDHLYFIFIDWVGTPPSIRIIENDNRRSIWFRTYRHKSFLYYYNMFYNGNKKSVPKLISKFLTPVSIAYWYMDDGSKEKIGYKFSTHAFIFSDQRKLVEALNKYKLDALIYKDRKYYYIYIKNVKKFNELVSPYILDIFRYKLH